MDTFVIVSARKELLSILGAKYSAAIVSEVGLNANKLLDRKRASNMRVPIFLLRLNTNHRYFFGGYLWGPLTRDDALVQRFVIIAYGC